MKKIWYASIVFILTISIALSITPASALAQQYNRYDAKLVKQDLALIDMKAEKIAFEKQSVRNDLRQLTMKSKNMESWFAKLDQINAEINKAQQYKDKYATFDKQKQQNTLQQLNRERQRILNLNGGITIAGDSYKSMDQLKAAYARIPREIGAQNEQYKKLSKKLNKLDQERNQTSSQLELSQRTKLSWHKIKVKSLQQDLSTLNDLVNDHDVWCIAGFDMVVGGAPPYITRKMAMQLISNKYLYEIETTPGAKFNRKELARRIASLRDQSAQIKEVIRKQIIPEKKQELADLQQKIAKETEEQTRSYDISGCWVIFLAQKDNPVINISHQGDGYSAVITSSGVLADLRPGHRLFTVKAVNNTTFEGFEYSTDSIGNPTTTPLQLLLGKSGSRMNYRSDDILSLGRCNN